MVLILIVASVWVLNILIPDYGFHLEIEKETYRYLFSALIQVFGALIAVDIIFLILRYQVITNKIDDYKFKIGLQVITSNESNRIATWQDRPHLYSEYSEAAIMFKDYPIETIYTIVEKTLAHLKKVIDNNQHFIENLKSEKSFDVDKGARIKDYQYDIDNCQIAIDSINFYLSHCNSYTKIQKKYPNLVVNFMLTPSILSIIFTMLLFVEQIIFNSGIEVYCTSFSIVIAAIGFIIVISLAHKTF